MDSNKDQQPRRDDEPVAGVPVIVPPPEMRKVVDKTAEYVIARGLEFEDKLREKEKGNPKFCFLNPGDPYFGFYQKRLVEFRAGLAAGESVDEQRSALASSAQNDAGKPGLSQKPQGPIEPPALEFAAETPKISALDMDVLKMTALFVARNGKQFMAQLATRESRNVQFDFLKPTHSCFTYFTKLVEQYTKILLPTKDLPAKLKRKATDRNWVLDRCFERAEWQRINDEAKREKERQEERERALYLSIDWHDFVVVQTVDFTAADDTIQLQPPTTIEQIQSTSILNRKAALPQAPPQASTQQHQQQVVSMDQDDGEMDMEE